MEQGVWSVGVGSLYVYGIRDADGHSPSHADDAGGDVISCLSIMMPEGNTFRVGAVGIGVNGFGLSVSQSLRVSNECTATLILNRSYRRCQFFGYRRASVEMFEGLNRVPHLKC